MPDDDDEVMYKYVRGKGWVFDRSNSPGTWDGAEWVRWSESLEEQRQTLRRRYFTDYRREYQQGPPMQQIPRTPRHVAMPSNFGMPYGYAYASDPRGRPDPRVSRVWRDRALLDYTMRYGAMVHDDVASHLEATMREAANATLPDTATGTALHDIIELHGDIIETDE